MTTKINTSQIKPRIVIEIDPATGQSNLKVHGMLNMIGVVMALAAQLNSLLPQLFTEIFKNAKVIGPNGMPIPGSLAGTQPGNGMTIEYQDVDTTGDEGKVS